MVLDSVLMGTLPTEWVSPTGISSRQEEQPKRSFGGWSKRGRGIVIRIRPGVTLSSGQWLVQLSVLFSVEVARGRLVRCLVASVAEVSRL